MTTSFMNKLCAVEIKFLSYKAQIHNPVADPENKAGGFTTTVRKSLHVTSFRGRVREGDVPPPARSAEAQRCSTICGRYLIEKSARQSTFNLA